MAVLDDIAAEKQRITNRLARVDAERERLAQQLAELDAAEGVLSRMAPGGARRPRRGRTAEEVEAGEAAPRRRRRRARQAEALERAPAARRGTGRGGRRTRQKRAMALGDATLQAVEALGNNASADQIREYLAEHFRMQVWPNHLGMALQRHRALVGCKKRMGGGQLRSRQTTHRRRCYSPARSTQSDGVATIEQ